MTVGDQAFGVVLGHAFDQALGLQGQVALGVGHGKADHRPGLLLGQGAPQVLEVIQGAEGGVEHHPHRADLATAERHHQRIAAR
ncbi:hypothetical protein D3C76_1470600 [compost metagenome]